MKIIKADLTNPKKSYWSIDTKTKSYIGKLIYYITKDNSPNEIAQTFDVTIKDNIITTCNDIYSNEEVLESFKAHGLTDNYHNNINLLLSNIIKNVLAKIEYRYRYSMVYSNSNNRIPSADGEKEFIVKLRLPLFKRAIKYCFKTNIEAYNFFNKDSSYNLSYMIIDNLKDFGETSNY